MATEAAGGAGVIVSSSISPGDGLVLRGRFLGTAEGRPYTGRDGQERVGYPSIKVLTGDRVERIEFRDRGAMDELVSGIEPEGRIEVPVYANGPWDRENGKPGRVRFSGRGAS